MNASDLESLFEPWHPGSTDKLWDSEMDAVAEGKKPIVWAGGVREQIAFEVDEGTRRGIPVQVRNGRYLQYPVAETAPVHELWRGQASDAVWAVADHSHEAWTLGLDALQSRYLGYSPRDTERYTAALQHHRGTCWGGTITYFLVDETERRTLHRVRGRYLNLEGSRWLFTPAAPCLRDNAAACIAPVLLARCSMTRAFWQARDPDIRSMRSTEVHDLDELNASLISRIEILGGDGWECA